MNYSAPKNRELCVYLLLGLAASHPHPLACWSRDPGGNRRPRRPGLARFFPALEAAGSVMKPGEPSG